MLALINSDLINVNNVRVLQCRGGGCFGAKTFDVLRTGQRAEWEQLHCDDAVETDLPGAIDNAHPAPSDFLQQFVIAKMNSWFWRRFPQSAEAHRFLVFDRPGK